MNMLTPRFLKEINANPTNVHAREKRFTKCLAGGMYDSWVKKCKVISNHTYFLFINKSVLVFLNADQVPRKALTVTVNWTKHSKEMRRKPFVPWFVVWVLAQSIIHVLQLEKFYVYGIKGGQNYLLLLN